MSSTTITAIRLEEGTRIPDALEEMASNEELAFFDVAGFGELAWVELAGGEGEPPRRFQGPLVMLDLKGRFRSAVGVRLAEYVCTLSRITDNGVQVIGGQLVRGEVRSAELAVSTPSAADPITTTAQAAADGEASGADDAADEAEREERWAAAVAESRRLERRARHGGDDDARPSRGDVVIHQQFGRCSVTRLDDAHITLRKPDGRQVQLGLSVLRFDSLEAEGGRGVFRVEVRTR